MNSDTIGERIFKLRSEKGISQAELAKVLYVTREAVALWEGDRRDLKTNYTIMIANYFEVTCDYILRGISAENTDINNSIGLSNDCIEALRSINDHQKTHKMARWLLKTINHLIIDSGIKENKFISQDNLLQQIAKFFNFYGNAKEALMFKNGDITSTPEDYYLRKVIFPETPEKGIEGAFSVDEIINSAYIFNIQLQLLKSKVEYLKTTAEELNNNGKHKSE